MRIAATTLASPLGRLVVAATERGVVRIAFDDEPVDAVLEGCRGAARAFLRERDRSSRWSRD